jgi:hypothetical protein
MSRARRRWQKAERYCNRLDKLGKYGREIMVVPAVYRAAMERLYHQRITRKDAR